MIGKPIPEENKDVSFGTDRLPGILEFGSLACGCFESVTRQSPSDKAGLRRPLVCDTVRAPLPFTGNGHLPLMTPIGHLRAWARLLMLALVTGGFASYAAIVTAFGMDDVER